MRLKLYIAYDGTKYRGWQRQKNTPHTIQEVLENRLSVVANTKVTTVASGRTDAGVHARVQVVHAEVPDWMARLLEASNFSQVTGLAEPKLKHALNSQLPSGIRILHLEQAAPNFHALRDAQKKTYLYFINTSPMQPPHLADYAWHLKLPLNWDAIEEATQDFVGRHDFKAFCAADTTAKTTIRTVFEARWGDIQETGLLGPVPLKVFRVTGAGFLKNMVRCMVGSLIHIGNGKADSTFIKKAFERNIRQASGPTAPPHGLWLWDVKY